jgi:hypothetical protein
MLVGFSWILGAKKTGTKNSVFSMKAATTKRFKPNR